MADYLMPDAVMLLEAIPQTANGKVDKRALPEPDMTQWLQETYVAPTNDTEEQLCAIWQQVLGLPKVGIADNFFEIGGHSISATKVISEIRSQLHIELPVRTIFEHLTIGLFAQAMQAMASQSVRPAITPQDRDQALRLSFAQQRLWFIQQLDPSNPQYNIPHALQMSGALDQQALQNALQTIVTP